MKAHRITIIIPCFNEEEMLPVYYQAMLPVMKQMNPVDFELLFIDDGSSDHTLLEMKQLHQKDPRCKYLSFSRNFGKEAAIYAGLSKASGDQAAPENQKYVLFYLTVSIKSSTGFQKQKLCVVPEIFVL